MAVASERMREDAREATAVAEAKAATGVSISEPAAEEETDRPGDRVAARAGAFVPSRAEDAATVVARLRALANREGAECALPAVARESLRHPLSAEIHFLQALLMLDLRRDREAARALKRILYIDRSLAVAHFLLGSTLRRQGDVTGARRAYARARDLARARPADEPLALTDGEPAGRLVRAASDEIAMLSGNEREAS